MHVRIGVVQSQKEIEVELDPNSSVKSVKRSISSDLSSGKVLWLTDSKGREVGVLASSVAYVELDPSASGRSIGFGG
ncbi:MAG: DUF3107 domain-containing protein [Acidimicrobiia bacterium]|nr:DUF3107 domain-containing protein [Acidimicrobiia bacterium]MYC57138.1 DUF3107 domain-containing protein [Acidimicrobiia bacterium]MYG93935.1 DUF3107 domain-containing protein [Acidimicrobiia bacterium]MYI29938.1 DUF3107 domain-containing protein [Acidimicrobiia bacterium]